MLNKSTYPSLHLNFLVIHHRRILFVIHQKMRMMKMDVHLEDVYLGKWHVLENFLPSSSLNEDIDHTLWVSAK